MGRCTHIHGGSLPSLRKQAPVHTHRYIFMVFHFSQDDNQNDSEGLCEMGPPRVGSRSEADSFPISLRTQDHELGGLKRNLFSLSSGGQKTEVLLLVRLVLPVY